MPDSPGLPLLQIDELIALQTKPAPFTPGEEHFWTDPHIARQMLATHLDPDTDAASRKPDTIRRTVEWLIQILDLKPGDRLIDLGCGPGLYTTRLAKSGLHVTGVDFSQNSIAYAVETARQNNLQIIYRCEDYLQLDDVSYYDIALLIYGDFCPLSPEKRTRLLANIHRALKPGGHFVLDVSTPVIRKKVGLKQGWYAVQSGFWKPIPHLVLEQGFDYAGDIFLDQYIVIELDGKISIYRNWFQDYTVETICAELGNNHFSVESLWGDLTGSPYTPEADWIGVIARKE